MKRLLLFQRFFVIFLFLAICTTSWARTDFTVNGINYGIYEDGTGVYVAKNNNYSGSAVIPSYVWDPNTGKKYTVMSIGYEAFEGCTGLTSVSIPNTVIGIGSFAFHGCSGLTSIDISGFVKNIGDYAFAGSGLKSITIPNSVTSIGHYTFGGCSSLASVTIGNSVTSIGGYAFTFCSSLTSISVPNSVSSIGNYAFQGCSGLTKAEFASIESLCKINFEGITSNPLNNAQHLYVNGKEVKDVVVPNSVTSIGKYAFYNCSSLTSVTISNSVTSIGKNAFSDCIGITSVTIGNSVTSIGDCAFSYCRGLTSVNIPNNVTSIGNDAFWGCSGLTSASIGNSVISIGNYAFSECTNLTSVTIPNSVTSIGEWAFDGCSGLTSVTIGNSVTNVGRNAFYNCSGLTMAEFASIESLCKIKFNDVTSNPLYYAHNLFIHGQEVKELIIPESVTSIGNFAFYGCSGLTSVTIPNSITNIGGGAFTNCYGLTKAEFASIESLCKIQFDEPSANPLYCAHNLYINGQIVKIMIIPESVTSIGDYSFYNCYSLKSVIIPESVSSIGQYAFKYCTGLTSIIIPNSMTSIGDYAFDGCSNLKEVICQAKQVPNLGYWNYYISTLYVPASSVEAYKSTNPWNNIFETILPIDEHYSQTPIQNVGELTNNEQIYTAETKRAAWYVPSGSTQLETTVYPNFVSKNSTSSNQQFAFIQHDGKFYIYCVGEGKILNGRTSNKPNRGVLVTENCQPVTITETGDMDYPFFFSFGGNFNINVGGDAQITIDYWSTFDDGNKVALRPVQGVMLDENDINRIIGYISGTIVIDEHYSQTPVQNVVELDNKQVYTAETKRAAWYVPTGSTQLETTEFPTIVSKSSTISSQQFAFIQHKGQYYIYCVGEGKILNGITGNSPNRGVLVTENCQPVTITETGDTDYPFFFTFGDDYNLNVGGGNQITIDHWSTLDDGNKVALRPVNDVVLSDKDMRRIIGYIDGCFVGDANGNGEVEIGDVTSVLTLMATPEATGYDNKAADANGNGEIEIGDVTTILTIMANGE